jgi:hypothetical protein
MRRFAQIALLACLCALASAALAFDNGQFGDVPAKAPIGFRSKANGCRFPNTP